MLLNAIGHLCDLVKHLTAVALDGFRPLPYFPQTPCFTLENRCVEIITDCRKKYGETILVVPDGLQGHLLTILPLSAFLVATGLLLIYIRKTADAKGKIIAQTAQLAGATAARADLPNSISQTATAKSLGGSRGRIRRQCLRILPLEIELSHLLQISFRESATKRGLQIARQPLQ